MTNEWIQFAFYAAFTVLGWWLRHKGILGPRPANPEMPWPVDQRAVIELLKGLLERLAESQPGPTWQRPSDSVLTIPSEGTTTSTCPPNTGSGERVGPP